MTGDLNEHQQRLLQQARLIASSSQAPSTIFGNFPQPPSSAGYTQNPYATMQNPEVNLFSQFVQLFPQLTDEGQQHAAGRAAVPELPAFSQSALNSLLANSRDHASGNAGAATRGGRGGRAATEAKSSDTHASRHQAAEQRRRARINERLDVLSKQ